MAEILKPKPQPKKMKRTKKPINLEKKLAVEKIASTEHGVTKRLLEKYKPNKNLQVINGGKSNLMFPLI